MKKILFPFRVPSDNQSAFVHAVRVSRKTKSQLVMFNSFLLEVDDHITKSRYMELLAEKRYEAFKKVMELKERYLVDFLNLKGDLSLNFGYKFIHGKQKQVLQETIDSLEYELIVYTHEKEFSLLSELLNHSPVHVMVIPESIAYKNVKKIAYAADFNKVKKTQELVDYTVKIANLLDAEITFIHVNVDGDSERIKNKETYDFIMQTCSNNARCHFELLPGNDVFESINKFISEKEFDMLTIVKRNKGFFEGLFHQSMIKKISVYSNYPVMVLMESAFDNGE